MSKRLRGFFLLLAALTSSASAAELPATKAPETLPPPPSCFDSLWDYLKSSVRDCPLRYGPFTLYGTLDGGYGYEEWGTRVGAYADKPNYAIQRNSGGAHWLWSANALGTSTVGIRLSQKISQDWEIVGAVEAGFNPFTLRLVNGPQSQADNNLYTAPNQRTAFDSARAGTWDNGQAFIGLSNPTLGTLTFGRIQLLSQSALSAYDPVASVAFSQLGFSALYATFGASATSRINTGFTYRLNYQNVRAAVQAQVGGYDQDNATTEQYQAQIGTDLGGFSFDAIAGYAKNALSFRSFAGETMPVGYNPYSIVRATAANTGGVELLGRYEWNGFKFYLGYIHSVTVDPSDPYYPDGVSSIAQGISVPPGYVAVDTYTVPRVLDTVWTGVRYAAWSNLDLAAGVYSESQNNFLAPPSVCTGSGTATSSSRCAGGRWSISLLAEYRPLPRLTLFAGLLVSTVYGGVASAFEHTQNIAPTAGLRVRF